MSDFTASNGVRVEVETLSGNGVDVLTVSMGGLNDTIVGTPRVQALREFFQKEEDDRLDRWRWPANPEYVVYAWTADPARNARGVTVLSESIPRPYTVWEDNIDTLYGPSADEDARALARKAAGAYFDAHPEPKPWHDAKPGEVWVFTLRDASDLSHAAVLDDCGDWTWTDGGQVDLANIAGARRIWPEVAS